MKKRIYVYLFDGYSDWEIAYLTPELTRSDDHELIYFSEQGVPVKSMGGLHVHPDCSLSEVELEALQLLVLPGGTMWERENPTAIGELVLRVRGSKKAIAAICAATTFLAKAGVLDDIRHTSNDLGYLKAMVPEYQGEDQYQNALATTDQQVITANGIAPIEFAREVFKVVDLHDEVGREKWFQLFKNGIWQA
ncbi:MAG: DJ-1/PfpI family protein [Saprospiraceae bacterium]|nr:DJ-1/PfpI family protein [Saprospiraceae bacterium]